MGFPCDYYFKGRKLTYDQFRKELKGLPMSEIEEMFPTIKDEGIKSIAWTTGEQQNDRYDLAKTVSNIFYNDNGRGGYGVFVKGLNGENLYGNENASLKDIESTLGKDIADKVANNVGEKELDDIKSLKGNDLKVGGKGMKGFYGSPKEGSLGIVGNVAKSLTKQEPKATEIIGGYDKRLKGGNVKSEIFKNEDGDWELKYTSKNGEHLYSTYFDTKEDAVKQNQKDISTQHSIDITPEIKASVEKGLPLFGTSLSERQQLDEDIKKAKLEFRKSMAQLSSGGLQSVEQFIKLAKLLIKRGMLDFKDFIKELREVEFDADFEINEDVAKEGFEAAKSQLEAEQLEAERTEIPDLKGLKEQIKYSASAVKSALKLKKNLLNEVAESISRITENQGLPKGFIKFTDKQTAAIIKEVNKVDINAKDYDSQVNNLKGFINNEIDASFDRANAELIEANKLKEKNKVAKEKLKSKINDLKADIAKRIADKKLKVDLRKEVTNLLDNLNNNKELNVNVSAKLLRSLNKRVNSITANNYKDTLDFISKAISDANYSKELSEIESLKSKAKKTKGGAGNLYGTYKSLLDIDEEFLSPNMLSKYKADLEKIAQKGVKDFTDIEANLPDYLQDVEDNMSLFGNKTIGFTPSETELSELENEINGITIASIDDYNTLKRKVNKANKHIYGLINEEEKKANPSAKKIEKLKERLLTIDNKSLSVLSNLPQNVLDQINALKESLINEAKQSSQNIDDTNFTPIQKERVKEFKSISRDILMKMSPAQLDMYSEVAAQLKNAYISPMLYEIINVANAKEIASDLRNDVKQTETLIEKASGFLRSFKNINKSEKDIVEKLSTVNPALKDWILGLGKNNLIWNNFIYPIGQQINKMDAFNGRTLTELEQALKGLDSKAMKLSPSEALREKARLKSKIKLGILMTQMDYESREDYEGLDDKGMGDKIKYLLKNKVSDYKEKDNDVSVEEIEEIYNELPKKANGDIDTQKVLFELTEGEKGVYDFVRKKLDTVISNMVQHSTESRGSVYQSIKNYFPLYTKDKDTANEKDDERKTLEKYEQQQGIKGKSINPRTTKISWTELDVEKQFKNAVESASRDYFMAEKIKEINMAYKEVLSEINKENKPNKDEVKRVLYAIKDDYINLLAHNLKARKLSLEPIIDKVLKGTSTALLANVERVPKEMFSNLAMEIGLDPTKITKVISNMSMSGEELAGYEKLTSDLGASIQFKPSSIVGAKQITGKERLGQKIAERVASFSDVAVSVAAWRTSFDDAFKKETGNDFDYKEYLNNEDYRDKYKSEINKSVREAELYVNRTFAPQAIIYQSEKIKSLFGNLDRDSVYGKLYSWMQGYQTQQSKKLGELLTDLYNADNQDRLKTSHDITKIVASNATFAAVSSIVVQSILNAWDDEEDPIEKAALKMIQDWKELSLATISTMIIGGHANALKPIIGLLLGTYSYLSDEEIKLLKQKHKENEDELTDEQMQREMEQAVADKVDYMQFANAVSRDMQVYNQINLFSGKKVAESITRSIPGLGVFTTDLLRATMAAPEIMYKDKDNEDAKYQVGVLGADLAALTMRASMLYPLIGEGRKQMEAKAKAIREERKKSDPYYHVDKYMRDMAIKYKVDKKEAYNKLNKEEEKHYDKLMDDAEKKKDALMEKAN